MTLVAALALQTDMVMVLLPVLGLLPLGFKTVFGFDPAPKQRGRGGSKFSVSEQVELLAPWVVRKCLAGQSFSAKDAWQAIPEFKSAYGSSKGVGDVLGHGHIECGPLQLYRGIGGNFRPVRENAGRSWDRCTEAQRQQIAGDLSLTVNEVVDQIWALPSVNLLQAEPATLSPPVSAKMLSDDSDEENKDTDN